MRIQMNGARFRNRMLLLCPESIAARAHDMASRTGYLTPICLSVSITSRIPRIDDWVGGVHLDSRSGRVWIHRDGALIRHAS